MTCIITGCVATHNGFEWVGGDLHQVGGAYIFNAIVGPKGEARWGKREDYAHYDKEVDFSESNHFFERRGVIVGWPAKLNQKADDYVHGRKS